MRTDASQIMSHHSTAEGGLQCELISWHSGYPYTPVRAIASWEVKSRSCGTGHRSCWCGAQSSTRLPSLTNRSAWIGWALGTCITTTEVGYGFRTSYWNQAGDIDGPCATRKISCGHSRIDAEYPTNLSWRCAGGCKQRKPKIRQ